VPNRRDQLVKKLNFVSAQSSFGIPSNYQRQVKFIFDFRYGYTLFRENQIEKSSSL